MTAPGGLHPTVLAMRHGPVTAAGKRSGSKVWRMADALSALIKRKRADVLLRTDVAKAVTTVFTAGKAQ